MRTADIVEVVTLAAWLAACGSMSSSAVPTAPTPASTLAPAPTAPPSPPTNGALTGIWAGVGSDSFSPERVTLVIEQTGASISGTAEINAVDSTDGSCGSCHKVKRGTLTGMLSGDELTISMKFPGWG